MSSIRNQAEWVLVGIFGTVMTIPLSGGRSEFTSILIGRWWSVGTGFVLGTILVSAFELTALGRAIQNRFRAMDLFVGFVLVLFLATVFIAFIILIVSEFVSIDSGIAWLFGFSLALVVTPVGTYLRY